MSSTEPTSPISPPDLTSPLAKVDPKSLQVLFNEDPEGLTEDEVDKICDALRADRAKFHAEPQARPKKVTPVDLKKKIDKIEAPSTLSIDDLEI